MQVEKSTIIENNYSTIMVTDVLYVIFRMKIYI